jgi:nitrite reductase/ring-hydroxylating ferredoxin subunit
MKTWAGMPSSKHNRRRASPDGSRAAHSRMPRQVRYRVARTQDLHAGESMKFMIPVRGTDEECFLINYRGHFHAYVNRCRHVPMAMDWMDNQFFDAEGRYLMCPTHTAYYEPASGECVAGPHDTCGKALYRVPLEIDAGVIYARPPEQEFADE